MSKAPAVTAIVCATLLGAAVAGPTHAQTTHAGVPRRGKEARAVRIDGAPVLDGRLDDPAWRQASFFSARG
ncbi:MAG: hypothetical protein HY337_04060, partial [Gemmatimonadetes bacterium]|nr:hypothetical protein [Gemmatimonadota bacterium]